MTSVTAGSLQVAPAAREVPVLGVRMAGHTVSGLIEAIQLEVDTPDSAPMPLGVVYLLRDDGNGRFDSGVDEVVGEFRFSPTRRHATSATSLRSSVGAVETFWFVANLRPAALGGSFTVLLTKLRERREGSAVAMERAVSVGGPDISVEDAVFASAGAYSGGGSAAAVRLATPTAVNTIHIGAQPVTGLRRESSVVYSFLLPSLPSGKAHLIARDAAGGVVARLEDVVTVNGGGGPARFRDVSMQAFPRNASFSQDAEVADVDGDGDPDLIVPAYSQQRDRIYINDGSGRFRDESAQRLPAVTADTVHIEPVDVDGDGDVDLVVGVEGGQNRIYLNDGRGVFADVTTEVGRMPIDRDYTEDLRSGDVDGDGDLDLVAANLVDPYDTTKGGQLRLYLNDGHGRFTDGTSGRIPLRATRTYDVNLGDLDGDGDLDIFATGYGEPDQVLINDGAGRFDATTASLPQTNEFHTAAVLGDLDGDGDLDVVVGTFLGRSRIYLNKGNAAFVDGSAGLTVDDMSTYDVNLADLDGDGNLDILFANTGNPSRIFLGDGRGRFHPGDGDFVSPDDNAYDVQVLDANGDGALDLFFAAWGDRQDALYLADRGPPHPDAPRAVRVEPNFGPVAGGNWVTIRGSGLAAGLSAEFGGSVAPDTQRIDNRSMRVQVPPGRAGSVDLRLVYPGGVRQVLRAGYAYEPPVQGALVDGTARVLGSEPESSTSVAGGDLNGDGLPDLVFGDQRRGARIRLGQKAGVMKRVAFSHRDLGTNDVELHDFDADGKLDMLLVAGAEPSYIYPGKGDGTFRTGIKLSGPALGAEDAAVGDLDGDGDLDLVFAVSGPEVVLRNDGGWKFTAVKQPFSITDVSRAITLGDFDGDKILDFAVSNFMQRTRLFLGDGKCRFVESKAALPDNTGDQSYGIANADVDGDGDLDLAVANGGAQVNRLFLNTGRGAFREAPLGVFRAALGGGAHVVFGDIDGNGRPDLFSAHFWGSNHLYFSADGRLSERRGVLPASAGGFAGATLFDVDADGDLDVILAAFWGGNRVLLNPLE